MPEDQTRETLDGRHGRSAEATAVPDEVARFAAVADAWWDPDGDFRPLHQLNPVRVQYVREHLCRHFKRDPLSARPLKGLDVLDIGCGGGLVAEPMTRLGARVTAIDAEARSIGIAAAHARQAGLGIDYRHAAPEDLAGEGLRFDVVLALEVVEHVADLNAFIAACAQLMRPDAAFAAATLNRTAKSLALGKIGAEYLLRWLPRGTHDWRKFVRPSELAAALRRQRLELQDLSGMAFNPLTGEWTLSDDLAVNYLAFAVAAADRESAVAARQ